MPHSSGATQSARAECDYDEYPYLSLPIAYTQPSRLAALAILFGLDAPLAAESRVLELGCASGGNLIPLAARFPHSIFFGIDLSSRQISDGQRRIAALGLGNIKLHQADLENMAELHEQFDFVICHGVFSWVPPTVQEAILRLTASCLTGHGIAAISFNVLPGWHFRSPVRDILRHQVGAQGTPRERIARARQVLEQLKTASTGKFAYGMVMRAEATRLLTMPSSYILGEFLTETNNPCSFRDFAEKAAKHSLAYLCEADLNAGAHATIAPAARNLVSARTARDRIDGETLVDQYSGRPFRRSLLVKSSAAASIKPPSDASLRKLHVSARGAAAAEPGAGGVPSMADPIAMPAEGEPPEVTNVLARLSGAYPNTLPIAELISDSDGASIAAILQRLVFEDRAVLSTLPVRAGTADDERPRASPLARADAAMGLPYVTSLNHVAVALTKIAALLTPRLDGSATKSELEIWLKGEIEAGRVPQETSPENAGKRVSEVVAHMANSGVLLP